MTWTVSLHCSQLEKTVLVFQKVGQEKILWWCLCATIILDRRTPAHIRNLTPTKQNNPFFRRDTVHVITYIRIVWWWRSHLGSHWYHSLVWNKNEGLEKHHHHHFSLLSKRQEQRYPTVDRIVAQKASVWGSCIDFQYAWTAWRYE